MRARMDRAAALRTIITKSLRQARLLLAGSERVPRFVRNGLCRPDGVDAGDDEPAVVPEAVEERVGISAGGHVEPALPPRLIGRHDAEEVPTDSEHRVSAELSMTSELRDDHGKPLRLMVVEAAQLTAGLYRDDTSAD